MSFPDALLAPLSAWSVDVDQSFGLSRPTVQGLASKGIQTNLKFLGALETGTQTSPFTAEDSAHFHSVVDRYTDESGLAGLEHIPGVAQSIIISALRQDIFRNLEAYNHASGNFADASKQIAEIRRQSSDAVISAVPEVFNTIHRDLMVRSAASLRQMASLADHSLWGTSTENEREMSAYFRKAMQGLDDAVRLLDSGDVQAATTKLESVLGESYGYTQWFNRAFRDSERQKFAARLGIIFAAGAAASVTGGASLGLMGYSATASASEIGASALAGSMLAGGLGFTAANRLLSAAILREPLLRKHSALENTLDLTQETLSVAGAMGTLRLYSILGAALPSAGGEFASVFNLGKALTLDFAGFTHWEMVGAANPDAPDLRAVFSRDQMAERLATVFGLRTGGAALRQAPAAAKFGINALQDLGREVLPALAPYPLMLASRINFKPVTQWLDKNLERAPIILIGAFNVNMSYALSLGLRYLSSRYFPDLADALPLLFSAGTDFSFFNPENLRTTWWQTNAFGLGVLIPFFAGYPGSFSRKIANVQLDPKDFPFADMTRGQIARTYATEFMWRGIQGVTKLLGFHLSQRNGRAAGFGLDLVANGMGDATYAAMFRTGKSFPELVVPSFIISALVGYANVILSQHKFSHVKQFAHRTILGIGKSGVYRGFCATDTLSLGLNMFLQVGYGMMAIWYALRATRTQPLEKTNTPKKDFTIVVMDSGLGGTHVLADIERRMANGPFERAYLVYVNALPWDPETGRYMGYNMMETMDQKAAVLDRVLASAQGLFKPDLFAMACNTLAVVYPETEFSRGRHAPVVNIVSSSLDQMEAALARDPNAKMVILGTPTTIGSGRYQNALIHRGISPDRIIGTACPDLAAAIEQNPGKARVLIGRYVTEATANLPKDGTKVFVSLNCTHYGYMEDAIRSEFEKHGVTATILNPNAIMMNHYLPANASSDAPITPEICVVSQFPLGDGVSGHFVRLVQKRSQGVADALDHYRHDPDLFPWKDLILWPNTDHN